MRLVKSLRFVLLPFMNLGRFFVVTLSVFSRTAMVKDTTVRWGPPLYYLYVYRWFLPWVLLRQLLMNLLISSAVAAMVPEFQVQFTHRDQTQAAIRSRRKRVRGISHRITIPRWVLRPQRPHGGQGLASNWREVRKWMVFVHLFDGRKFDIRFSLRGWLNYRGNFPKYWVGHQRAAMKAAILRLQIYVL